MDERRTRRERSLRVDDGLERIVLHDDQLDGVLGRVPALGDHGRDRFPNVAYLAERQARPLTLLEDGGWKDLGTEGQPHPLQRTRHVLAREHTTHARQAERCARIDLADPGVRMRASHEGDVQRAGQADVVDVGRSAAKKARILYPPNGSADELHQRHRPSPSGARAADTSERPLRPKNFRVASIPAIRRSTSSTSL